MMMIFNDDDDGDDGDDDDWKVCVQIKLEHGLIYEAARLHCFFTTGQTFNLEKGGPTKTKIHKYK